MLVWIDGSQPKSKFSLPTPGVKIFLFLDTHGSLEDIRSVLNTEPQLPFSPRIVRALGTCDSEKMHVPRGKGKRRSGRPRHSQPNRVTTVSLHPNLIYHEVLSWIYERDLELLYLNRNLITSAEYPNRICFISPLHPGQPPPAPARQVLWAPHGPARPRPRSPPTRSERPQS